MINVNKTSVMVCGDEETLVVETITAFYSVYSFLNGHSKEKYRSYFLKHLSNPNDEYINEMRKKVCDL